MQPRKKFSVFVLLTGLICLLAVYIHWHRQGQTGKIDAAVISVTGALQTHFFYVAQGGRTIFENYFFLVNTKKRNEELESQVRLLHSELTSAGELELENKRFKEMLEFRNKIEQKLLAARVVAHDSSSDYFGIRVDRGSRDGVHAGMGVISPHGVIGRVLRVTDQYSDVLTLVDPTSNIDAIIQRSRARGIVSGQAKQLICKLKYIDRLEDIAVNDVVVSSSFGSIFPPGLLIGQVTAVIPNPNGILQTIAVKSAVDIYRLEEVFIVFPPAKSETVIKQ